MTEQEKARLYTQMMMILNEVQRFMRIYDSLKDRLFDEDGKSTSLDCPNNHAVFGKEIENQNYLNDKRRGKRGYDYQTLALTIASLLKESGKPLSTEQIHQQLIEKGYILTRNNLSTNILRKAHLDTKINVERAYRGYWQYRLIR